MAARNMELLMRALFYRNKAQDGPHRDPRYDSWRLMDEAIKACEEFDIDNPSKKYGSWNHFAVEMACSCLFYQRWDRARDFFSSIKRIGMNEYGPLYWVLTAYCVEQIIPGAPEDVHREARAFLGFLEAVAWQSEVAYPNRLELVMAQGTANHDRVFRKPGGSYVPCPGQRGIFQAGLGWHLENYPSAWYHDKQTPRSEKFKFRALTWDKEDADFDGSIAFRTPQAGTDQHVDGYKFTTQFDWVRFKDGSLLITTGAGDHSTKPPVRMVYARPGGLCTYYSPVEYKGDKHYKPSYGEVVVDDGMIFGHAYGQVHQRTIENRIEDVVTWTRLTTKGEWQAIDPLTQRPVDVPPPPPPEDEPPEPPKNEKKYGLKIFGDLLTEFAQFGKTKKFEELYYEWLARSGKFPD